MSFRSFDEQGNMIRTGRGAESACGMVSAGRQEAGCAGREILAAGGNAVDAAVAVAFALGVCEPNASGLGGGGFLLFRDAKNGENRFLDFREPAPRRASPEMYRVLPDGTAADEENVYGGKSVAVPGEVSGLLYALAHWGTMTSAQVLAPAIRLAEEGFVITPILWGDLQEHRGHMEKYGAGARLYVRPDGTPLQVGDIFRNPQLAAVLRRIALQGRAGFYEGPVAEAVVAAAKASSGVLELSDLRDFQPRELAPVCGSYRGYEVISSPPPSSGGAIVVEALNLLEHFDLSVMPPDSPARIHLLSEVFKRCYADRQKYMGDPDFGPVPLRGLMDKAYASERAAGIDLFRAAPPAQGEPWKYESPSTTHFSVADKDGNLVAATRTINHFFGSSVAPEGLGFCLNDTMEDFSLDPTSANCVAPGKKSLSSMSPTFLLKDGRPVAVLGSPGGLRIISTVVQVISNLIDYGMPLQAALDAPRMYDDHMAQLHCEGRLPAATVSALRDAGHTVTVHGDWDRVFGGVHAVYIRRDGTYEGAADPRRDGCAVGV
ncbi:MAG: gamma-glutamyltransferase [Clostridiaceae bacterium]|nr:gamma-glutamyltransferase [Clostridiaceae bacterium]